MSKLAIDIGFDWQQKFESENAVRDQLERLTDNLEGAVSAELMEIMEMVKDLAVELCPKETGALASSISLESGSISSGDFFNASIYAGSPDIINPISGKPTSEYAQLVHDGHALRNGTFFEGEPFLEDALMAYEGDIEEAVTKALSQLLSGD